jgi:hypothetical protein
MLDVNYDWTIGLLDQVDITRSPEVEAAALRDKIPLLEESLQKAREWVAGALAPVSAWHPADDTWDDQIYFTRAYSQSGYERKSMALCEAEREFQALIQSGDPGRDLAGYVLTKIHAHLKASGYATSEARSQSSPVVVGIPLAKLLWEARNQDQHYNEPGDLRRPVLDVFAALSKNHPSLFGLSRSPEQTELRDLVKQRSWAPEVLQILGWTSRESVAKGLASLASGIASSKEAN